MPRDIIDDIMKYLPLHDAARMCVLSHKWQEIWASIPQLLFDASFFARVLGSERLVSYKFCGIVSKIILQHKGPIEKFSLYVPPLKLTDQPDITQWISFLSTTGTIKEFSLQMIMSFFILTSHLFSWVSLERLTLHRCAMSLPCNFKGFMNLVSLELHNIIFRDGELDSLIACCPLLEELSVKYCKGFDHVNVNAPKLRQLIVTGSLKSLTVGNSENLLSASITLEIFTNNWHKTSIKNLMEAFANSAKLEKLCFGGFSCKVLFKEHLIPTTFENIRSLELSSMYLSDLDGFSSAVRALQACPNVEKLVISVNKSTFLGAVMLDYNPHITLRNLRHAKVGISSSSAMEFKLIEFLLACSPVLEILSLEFINEIRSCIQFAIRNLVSHFYRASAKVHVIYPHIKISTGSSGSSSDSDSSSESVSEFGISSYSTSSGDTSSVSSSDSD